MPLWYKEMFDVTAVPPVALTPRVKYQRGLFITHDLMVLFALWN